jgi:hypothetical protein
MVPQDLYPKRFGVEAFPGERQIERQIERLRAIAVAIDKKKS